MWELIKCKYLNLKGCANRDENQLCHALQSCNFKGLCPFYIKEEKALKDLMNCANRLGMKFEDYMAMLYKSGAIEKYKRG